MLNYLEARTAGIMSANDLLKQIDLKLDKLVSGLNIKTINNESIVGSGNLITVIDKGDYITLNIGSLSYNLLKYNA